MAMVSDASRIFLIGPMGTGKTTIGSQLARQLKYEFLDSDQVLESRTGASISLIFDVEGEAGFRERECKIVDELTQIDKLVLGTGGGVILREDNREWLAQRGLVVYLRSDVEALVQRTRFDHTRPLLQTPDPAKTLTDMLEVRGPLYESIADLTVDTGNLSIKQVIKKIVSEIL